MYQVDESKFEEVKKTEFYDTIGQFEHLEIHIVNPYSYPYTSEFRHNFTHHIWGIALDYCEKGTYYPVLTKYYINKEDKIK